MVQALIVQNLTAEIQDVEPTLDGLQSLVGGDLEILQGDDWHAYRDESGRLKRLPPNRAASVLARTLGWQNPQEMVGTVIFLGETDDGAGEGDVPPSVLTAAQELGLIPRKEEE